MIFETESYIILGVENFSTPKKTVAYEKLPVVEFRMMREEDAGDG